MAPPIIERASIAAYDFPSVSAVSAKVASATEGAAPKRPAKRLGLKMSPRSAKAETSVPPSTMRRRISFIEGESAFFDRSHALLDTLPCTTRPLHVENAIFFARLIVVVDEGFFQFLNKLFPEIFYVVYVLPLVIGNLHSNNSVIAFGLFAVALFAFDYSN